jgi:MerR HTH family regulatory protein
VSESDLLSIGMFAIVSGLSINALRHYDDLGLLQPAFVDPHTGYRRYRPEQVREARMICALRRVDRLSTPCGRRSRTRQRWTRCFGATENGSSRLARRSATRPRTNLEAQILGRPRPQRELD